MKLKKLLLLDIICTFVICVILTILLIISILDYVEFKKTNERDEMFEANRPEAEVYIPEVREYLEKSTPTKETVVEEEEVYELTYDPYELDLLARVIFAEAGSDWLPDNMLYYTGSVVLNRVKSEDFPNTLHEVVYQDGQYGCVDNGSIEKDYNDRALHVAEDLLLSGSCLPVNVVFQAQSKQGSGVYTSIDYIMSGTTHTMYFCYKN